LQISVVIPTYNRPHDLNKCLDSIIVQTKLPKEVMVVDNGNNPDTVELVEKRKREFEAKGVILKYMKNERENSITIAKNIGIDHSTGDIISFLDDDLVLDRKYYEEIIKVYRKMLNALGVEGYDQEAKEDERLLVRFRESLLKPLYLFSSAKEKGKCRVLPSLGITYPYPPPDKLIPCEWLSGASTYKRSILQEIKPDENLKKYSWNEDQDLSYRIFKKYPGSLFLTPHAKYWHERSKERKLPKRELIYMVEVYDLYLFYKNINQNLKNKVIYWWSRIGRMIVGVAISLFKQRSITVIKKELKCRIGALIYCIKYIREIKKGDLRFFNETLK